MTDRWRDVFVAATFGVALVLLLHVAAGCGDGDKKPACDWEAMGNRCHDAAVSDANLTADAATMATDSGGGSDAPGTDAGGLPDAASLPDAPAAD